MQYGALRRVTREDAERAFQPCSLRRQKEACAVDRQANRAQEIKSGHLYVGRRMQCRDPDVSTNALRVEQLEERDGAFAVCGDGDPGDGRTPGIDVAHASAISADSEGVLDEERAVRVVCTGHLRVDRRFGGAQFAGRDPHIALRAFAIAAVAIEERDRHTDLHGAGLKPRGPLAPDLHAQRRQ